MSTELKLERNLEIVRRRLAGESASSIARELGFSVSRVCQIVARYRDQCQDQQAAPVAARKAESGLWECTEGGITRAAHTPQGAYQRWLTAAIKAELEGHTAAVSQSVAAKPIAARRPKQSRPSVPVVVHGEAPTVRPDQVTLVPGAAPRPVWKMPQGLRLAAERASAVQVPLRSPGGLSD